MESKEYDYINPSHYKQGGKETIEKMVDIWGAENVAIHCEITAFKYMERLGAKPDQPIERDLAKARWYLNKAEELKTKKFAKDIREALATPEIMSTIYNHVSASTIAPTREADGYIDLSNIGVEVIPPKTVLNLCEDIESTWSERKKATFKFFNEFPEPYRTQAKNNYCEAMRTKVPESPLDSLDLGFDWSTSQELDDYWRLFAKTLSDGQ